LAIDLRRAGLAVENSAKPFAEILGVIMSVCS